MHIAVSAGQAGTIAAIVVLCLFAAGLVALVIVLGVRARRAAARVNIAEKGRVAAEDEAAGAKAEADAGRMSSEGLLDAVTKNLDGPGGATVFILGALVAALVALSPVPSAAAPMDPPTPEAVTEAPTNPAVVPDEVETPADYFAPYLLRTGEMVGPAEVFGFHRRDVEKIYAGQERLKSCRKNLNECLDIEPPPNPIDGFRWGWLETGVGVAAGAGLSVLIFYLAK